MGLAHSFRASAVFLVIGYYIRIRIAETPVLRAALDAGRRVRVPFVEVWRRRPGVLVLATLGFVLAIMLFYVITTFCLSYATGTLHIDKTTMLIEEIVAAPVMAASTLGFAALSDRVRRRAVSIAAAVLSAVWAFPLFWLMQIHRPLLIGVATVVGLLCFGLIHGPLGTWCPELFRVRYRYTGASFVYGVTGIVGGGISPLVATDILSGTHSTTGISWYIVGIAVLSLVCLPFLAETCTADYSDGLLARYHRDAPTLAQGQLGFRGRTA